MHLFADFQITFPVMDVDGSPAPESQSTGSSGRGTPQISNPGTPRSLADQGPEVIRGTPPPPGPGPSGLTLPQVQFAAEQSGKP